jgi:hypothetical protein
MNSRYHSRLLGVLLHACRLFVSFRQHAHLSDLSNPDQKPHRATSPLHPTLKLEDHPYHRILLTPLHPIRAIQSA